MGCRFFCPKFCCLNPQQNPPCFWCSQLHRNISEHDAANSKQVPIGPSEWLKSVMFTMTIVIWGEKNISKQTQINYSGWWCNNHLEKYKFVNGKDDIHWHPIYYGKQKMFETTNQYSIHWLIQSLVWILKVPTLEQPWPTHTTWWWNPKMFALIPTVFHND